MIVLNDSEGKTITKIEEGHAIKFHDRIIINPGCFVKEGDSFMLFTKQNLDSLTKYYNDELVETLQQHLESKKEFIEYMDKTNNRIKQLEKDNQELKQLNNKLSLKIIDLNKD